MLCSLRIPDVLQARIDEAAGSEGRSKWILEACRMRLDAEPQSPSPWVGSEDQKHFLAMADKGGTIKFNLPQRADMQALRDICAGNVFTSGPVPKLVETETHQGISMEIIEGEIIDHTIRCSECDSKLVIKQNKWACIDLSCAMYGKEQKPKNS